MCIMKYAAHFPSSNGVDVGFEPMLCKYESQYLHLSESKKKLIFLTTIILTKRCAKTIEPRLCEYETIEPRL